MAKLRVTAGGILDTLRAPHIKYVLSFSLLPLYNAALESIFLRSKTSKSFWGYLCRHECFLYETKIFMCQNILMLESHTCDASLFIQVHSEFYWVPAAAIDFKTQVWGINHRNRFSPEDIWESTKNSGGKRLPTRLREGTEKKERIVGRDFMILCARIHTLNGTLHDVFEASSGDNRFIDMSLEN